MVFDLKLIATQLYYVFIFNHYIVLEFYDV